MAMRAALAALCVVFLAGTASASVFGTRDTTAWRELTVGYAISNDLRGVSLGAKLFRSETAELGVKVMKFRSRVVVVRSASRVARTEDAAAGRVAALPAAYPVEPDYSATTLAISAAYHPMSRLDSRPVDLALVAGGECSFYGGSSTRSSGLRAGGNVSRQVRLTEWLRVAPRAGMEWDWTQVWQPSGYTTDLHKRSTLRVLEFGIETDYTLPWGQRLVVDNALRSWERPDEDGRRYSYEVSLGIGLPARW